jgi:hypothetical protein
MRLSIIVPVFNAEKYLRPCLDSLVNQMMTDYEIILVNDGSTDSSAEIMEEYRKRYPDRIRIMTVENGGQARARNLALEEAKGDYIGFTDSDDTAHTDMFPKLCDAAERENADIAVCDCWRVEPERKVYQPARTEEKSISASGAVWNKIFRRDFIGDIRFPEGRWYEDLAFSAKLLAKADKIVFVQEALYDYRCGHTSTMTNQNSRKNLDLLAVMEDICGFLDENGKDGKDYLILSHVLLDAIKRVNYQQSPDKQEVLEELRAFVRKEIPNLLQNQTYREQTRGRKTVMFLNYYGCEKLACTLLKLTGGA